MNSLPANFNVIYQNPNVPVIEELNKILYDQKVLLQPTISFMDAYALMPSNNASPIAIGSDVAFTTIGSTSGSDIVPATSSSFTLGPIGVYDVFFQVGFTDVSGAQLVLTLNGIDISGSVVGAIGSTELVGRSILTTTAVNTILTVRNPSVSTRTLTVTASLGGAKPVSAHLIITRLR